MAGAAVPPRASRQVGQSRRQGGHVRPAVCPLEVEPAVGRHRDHAAHEPVGVESLNRSGTPTAGPAISRRPCDPVENRHLGGRTAATQKLSAERTSAWASTWARAVEAQPLGGARTRRAAASARRRSGWAPPATRGPRRRGSWRPKVRAGHHHDCLCYTTTLGRTFGRASTRGSRWTRTTTRR